MLQTIKINNKEYYLADDVYKLEPTSFVGCSKTSRLIVTNKKLKSNDYLYVKYIKSKNEWIPSEESYKVAKVLLSKEWVENNVNKFKNNNIINDTIDTSVQLELCSSSRTFPLGKVVQPTPPLLTLENNEKFMDIDGNILDIEVRGEKEINKIYFKVKDIEDKFKLNNVNNTIIKNTSSFIKDLHYKIFNSIKLDQIQCNARGNPNRLYLTFKGLTKLLYVSHSKNAEHFQDWANKILFTHQLADQEDKEELASSLLGVNHKTIKDVFKTNTSKTPCVYLYFIGNAKEIINNKYDENDIICKFGCTDDLPRRCNEHEKYFKKEFNKNIELIMFSIIETKYIFEAECNIKQYFKSNKLDYKDTKELIIINKNNLDQIKQHYRIIQNSYIGQFAEMNNKIIELEKQLIEYKNIIQLKDKDLLFKEKEIQLLNEKHKNELQVKDIQLLEFKIKMLEK